jgi:hypothetical protein
MIIMPTFVHILAVCTVHTVQFYYTSLIKYVLYELFNDSHIVNYIKAKRLAWAGHLIRISDERTLKKIFNTKPEGTRSAGRPKL